MARPVPVTLLESYNEETDTMLQVNEAEGYFALFYKGAPINLCNALKWEELGETGKGPKKYVRCQWPQSGHAFSKARKLNKLYDTDEFTVVKVTEVKTLDDSYYANNIKKLHI
jgi:hypothetical protein